MRQELTADGRESGVEHEETRDAQMEPFDPKSISIDAKAISMDAVIRRIRQGTIRLAPPFQRQLVWDERRQSQLIESLMLKIPLPMFYVAADEDGNWDVVDGLQRLTTLKRFVLGEKYLATGDESQRGEGLCLKNLEFWGDHYNGAVFKQLPPAIANNIMETELRFTIINPGTPDEVKFTIFKRINTGGLPLSAQEIRHALYQGSATDLLEELVNTKEYKQATNESVNDSRMAGRELCLRFLAFSLRSPQDYKRADMDLFLNETMRIINCITAAKPPNCFNKIFKDSATPNIRYMSIEELKNRFKMSMKRSYSIFGKHTFRKSIGNEKRSPINKTLFETWGNILADLSDTDYETLQKGKNRLLSRYSEKIKDTEFVNLLARDSWKAASVKNRYNQLNKLVRSVIDEER